MYASPDVEMTSEAIIAGAVSQHTLHSHSAYGLARLGTSECSTTTSAFPKTIPHLLRASQSAHPLASVDNTVPTAPEPTSAVLDTSAMSEGTLV